MSVPDQPLKLAVLISGSGTTLQNLIDHIGRGQLHARIDIVIASRSSIAGIDRAQLAKIPCQTIERKLFPSLARFSHAVFHACREARCDLICLGGWLSLLEIPPEFEDRILNIHPSLLPSFGGKGMFGSRVHRAVLDHGCKVSGCTVHFVDRQYDNGPIILQRVCPVLEDDTAATLAHRVFEEEKIAYPHAIELFRAGRLRIESRHVKILT